MSKLFGAEDNSVEEAVIGRLVREGIEIEPQELDLEPMVEDFSDYMVLASEHLEDLNFKLSVANNIRKSMTESKVESKEYLYGLESRSELLGNIAGNLGVKVHVPALEDFTSPYSLTSSHQVSMESVSNVLKKIWEKIRDFFRAFFKKLSAFLKRLTNSNQDLDVYEKYVVDLMRKIKKNDLKTTRPKDKIPTKLPMLVCDARSTEPSPEDAVRDASLVVRKLEFAVNKVLTPGINRTLTETLSTVDRVIKRIESYSNDSINAQRVIDDINEIAISLNLMIEGITNTSVRSADLPTEEYAKLRDLVPASANASFRALMKPSDNTDRLPKSLNIFTVTSQRITEAQSNPIRVEEDLRALREHIALGLVGHQRDSEYVVGELLPLPTYEHLDRMHNSYKDMQKLFKSIENFTKLTHKLEDSINSNLKLMASRISNKIEGLRYVEVDVTSAANMYYAMLLYASVEDDTPYWSKSFGMVKDFDKYLESYPGKDRDVLELFRIGDILETGAPLENDGTLHQLVARVMAKPGISSKFNELFFRYSLELTWSEYNPSTGISEEEARNISEALSLLETILNRSFISFQQVIKVVCGDVSVSYTELRYAMIKYLYDSARTFG